MADSALLDELSGFEFEDLMVDVFRHLGYENVRQVRKTGDKGRDIIMEEVVDGTRQAVIVECKHTGKVGRPVVQKLHSAVRTYEFDGPTRGIVATTGRFTTPAIEYAAEVGEVENTRQIELIDGMELRDLADEVGLNLRNGRIEVICDRTLWPFDPTDRPDAPVREAVRDIDHLSPSTLPDTQSRVVFVPIIEAVADVEAVFETKAGVIHQLDQTVTMMFQATRGDPDPVDKQVRSLLAEHGDRTTTFNKSNVTAPFDMVDIEQFGWTETKYKEWATDHLQEQYTETVTYTGDNNVTYTKTCQPNRSDIAIRSMTPVYVPLVRHTTHLQEHSYSYEYFAAGGAHTTTTDGIHRCVHCDTAGTDESYTYCSNCGSINCSDHIHTERLEGTPVCTGCAVTDRFALRKKYFYNQENLEQFREQYASFPLYRKLFENRPLVAVLILTLLALIVGVVMPGLL